MTAINSKEIRKNYGATEALRGIDLDIGEGEIFGLIGPDGAGKTTLIRILTSLLMADSGECMVLGLDPVTQYQQLRDRLGYMPGKFSLYQDLTVEENLRLFASIYQTTIEENYHLIADIYDQIASFKDRKAGDLSGGMKQKLALSCAMIHKPDVLFLDEPTTGVDPVSRKEFWEILKRLNQDGLTILVSTPYMDEAELCHRIALIQNGSLMAVDTPEQVTGRFKKPLFAIKSSKKQEIIKDLRLIHPSGAAYSFGTEIHYSDDSSETSINSINNYLTSKGHHEFSIKKIQPGIEDTFMELMSQHEK